MAEHFQPVQRFVFFVCVAFAALSLSVCLDAQDPPSTSSLRGTVRDSRGTPIPSVTVSARQTQGTVEITSRTDARGDYTLSPLNEGVYTLRAELSGYTPAVISSLFIGAKENKVVDVTLEPAQTGKLNGNSGSTQFFDEPHFTVSGVTDTTNLGGHGSDTAVRTREVLARDAAALGRPPVARTATTKSEQALREEVQRDGQSFEANRDLGKVLLNDGKPREAIPYLDRASSLKPEDFENSYSRALANFDAGNYGLAREQAQAALSHGDAAELHHLLAESEEKLGDSLNAVREYQRAAELDPREPYVFDWGAELLVHHAAEPALEVFAQGNRLFPRSARMLIGLGAACFARGDLDNALERLDAASAIAPNDPAPYLFLGKMEMAQTAPTGAAVAMLRRFAALHRESAEANYYYAVALWKQQKAGAQSDSTAAVESLLLKAIQLDHGFAPAHLQLGIVYSSDGETVKAIAEYQQALRASQAASSPAASSQVASSPSASVDDKSEAVIPDPIVEEAHYRLAQAYRAAGQSQKAKAELQIYEQLTKESAQKEELDRHELRQFLYTLRDQPAKQ